ncbi:MAG: hypothetical protein WCP01_11490 [Methylococcaceae bacterium]
MNLKQRVEKLEEEAKKADSELGRWARPIGHFYGLDEPLVWVTRTQTLDDFYGQGLPGLDEMYENLPETRQPPTD